jgi:hypothetical protein
MSNQPTNQQYGEQLVNTIAQEFLVNLRQKHTEKANEAYMELLEARKEGTVEDVASAQGRLDFHTAAENKAYGMLMSLQA